MIKCGRPRIDATEEFRRGFATILPRLRAKEISQGEGHVPSSGVRVRHPVDVV